MKQRGGWRSTGLVMCALMIAVASFVSGGAGVAGQETGDSTPAPGVLVGQDGGQQPEVTPTPVVGSASGQGAATSPPAEETPQAAAAQSQTSGPVASGAAGDTAPPVLAQGLIYLTGDDVIWQVREIEISGAETVTGNARVVLQRSGASVIRNDLTGKRTRLEPGEAYFAAASDPYTTFPDGTQASVVWIFEIATTNQVGEGAFYLSPDVPGYAEATYDFEMTRVVVADGEASEFTGGDGPSLLMLVSGSAEVTLKNDVASLKAKDGLVVDDSAIVTATDGEAVYVAFTIGPKVADTSAAAPAAAQAPATTGDAGTAETTETPGDEAAQQAAPAEATGENGAFVTSIKVGAVESIGVTLYVDGVLVFDGWLEPGQWTDFYTGSVFEVYTTSGANTSFQNTCSTEPFWMDTEPGETSYVLQAGPSSCAPVG